jgi:RNA polymerase-interacting CarD/CdnL/TRCF family regulator
VRVRQPKSTLKATDLRRVAMLKKIEQIYTVLWKRTYKKRKVTTAQEVR